MAAADLTAADRLIARSVSSYRLAAKDVSYQVERDTVFVEVPSIELNEVVAVDFSA